MNIGILAAILAFCGLGILVVFAMNQKTIEDYYEEIMKEVDYLSCRIEKASGCQYIMTGNEYQELASRTMDFKNMDSSDQEYHALFGMSSEIGELHGIYQKYYQGHKDDEEHKKKEVGDLLWFIAEYCTANGWMLEDIMQLNIDKLIERYPEGFDPEKSQHRKAGDI